MSARATAPSPVRRRLPTLLAIVLAASAAAPTRAVLPRVPPGLVGDPASLLPPRPFIAQEAEIEGRSVLVAADPGLATFLATTGGTWHATFDRRTGRPSMIWGSGIPWLPGAGNTLSWETLLAGAQPPASGDDVLAWLEARARRFLSDNPALMRVPDGVALVLDRTRSGLADGDRLALVTFRLERDGIPVPGASVFFRLNSGNVVQLGCAGVSDDLAAASTTPTVPADDALEAARVRVAEALGLADLTPAAGITALLDPGTLTLSPWAEDLGSYRGAPGLGLSHRLAWTVAFRLPSRLETWSAGVDALTGELLWLEDANLYACPTPTTPMGRVTGGVILGPLETTTEVVRAMPQALVVNGASKPTDADGAYPYTVGQPASTGLDGVYFDMSCQGCSSPSNASVVNATSGLLALGTGGANEVGNGASTPSERNVFYHLNVTRQLADKHLNDTNVNGFFDRLTPAFVNIARDCNAFWDMNSGSVNFFRALGACNNTGDIDDVVMHEWGHGLDQFTNGGLGPDGAWREGMADVNGFLNTHDGTLGPYFYLGNAAGLREADETVGPFITPSNAGMYCPRFMPRGPAGYEIHCEGQIYSQASWRFSRNLVAKYGEATGWYQAERLFYVPLLAAGTYVPNQTGSMYDAIAAADDDNGNLADGIPDGAELNDAFAAHEIAGTPNVGDSPECAPPGTPVITATPSRDPMTGLWRVDLSWTSVIGAARYAVVRNERDGRGGDLPVGSVSVPTTTLVDHGVLDGVTYLYRVAAISFGGCMSTGDNRKAVPIPGLVTLDLASFAVDDSAGNGNGVAEPGEQIVISIAVAGSGASGVATDVLATLEATWPGVTVTRGVAPLGDIPAGSTRASAPPHFAVALDRSRVSCGDKIPFKVLIESSDACASADILVPVGATTFLPTFSDDFETDTGWRVDPAGTDTATDGAWVREEPLMTVGGNQPGEDHTPGAGRACWVTGNSAANLADPDDDDVEGGCTTLQSRVYDCGGERGLQLRYWRYYQLGGATDDHLQVDISNDAGGSWRPLEWLPVAIQPFQQATFDLDTVLRGPADRVALRFQACDVGSPSIVEALVDDVAIGRDGYVCAAPDARPLLSLANVVIGDSAAFGSTHGNGNGAIDPGEIVRLPVDLTNAGEADATNVRGTIAIMSAPPGVVVTDATATWPAIATGATSRTDGATPHFEIDVPTTAACGDAIVLSLDATYDGPSGSYVFSTQVPLVVGTASDADLLADDFEGADNGWTHGAVRGADEWRRAAPVATSPMDPPVAHSGAKAWGTDPGGSGSDGNYGRDADTWLQSPPIDCSGRTGVHLGFWRWLSVQDAVHDHARVLVNGTEVWANPIGTNLDDTPSGWTYQEYDISAIADGAVAVSVRFTLSSDADTQLGGWAIDDVRVYSRTIACDPVSACRVTGTPPATGPVLRATGRKSLTEAEFSWTGAPVPGTGELYRFYRGSSPRALATLLTPDAFTGTSFDDTAATPERVYYYRLVMANCNDVEGPPEP